MDNEFVKTDWEYERSSGYAGARNKNTGEWVHLYDYNLRLKKSEELQSQSADVAETTPDSDKDEEIKRLREALEKIEKWELPTTGKFWDEEKTRPTSYETEYGSNGAREYIRNIAKQALQSK